MLDEEEREDAGMREKFQEEWRLEPSNKLTDTLRKNVRNNSALLWLMTYDLLFVCLFVLFCF